MSSEIVVREKQAIAQADSFGNYAGMLDLAAQLVTTGFLPQAIKTPAQALAIILTGKELGLGPMQSLRSIYIVQGKPTLAADLQLALYHNKGGKSHFESLTDTEAVLRLEAPWLLEPHVETFTMRDAQAAGVTGNPTWKKFPKAMLRSRVITAGLKSVGFEPTTGVYDPEELGVEPEEVVVEEPSKARGAAEPEVTPERPASSTGRDSPSPAPQLKRAKLTQDNVNKLLGKAGDANVLRECVARALGGEHIERITDSKQWPEMSHDDYEAILKQIALTKSPDALEDDTRGADELIADAKKSPAARRKEILDAAMAKGLTARLLNDLALSVHKQKFAEVTDDEILAQMAEAVRKWV